MFHILLYFSFLPYIHIHVSKKETIFYPTWQETESTIFTLTAIQGHTKKIINQREKFSGACFANLLLPNFVRNIEFNFCKIFSPLDLNYWNILSIVLSSNLSQQKASFIVHHCSLFLYFNLWSWHHCIK